MCRVAKRQFKVREEKERERRAKQFSLIVSVCQTDYQRTGVGAAAKDRLAAIDMDSDVVCLVSAPTPGSQHHEFVGRGSLTGAQAQTRAVPGECTRSGVMIFMLEQGLEGDWLGETRLMISELW